MLRFSAQAFQSLLAKVTPDSLFLLIDEKASEGATSVQHTIGELCPSYSTLSLSAGEEIKSFSHVEEIAAWLNRQGATRSSLLVAIGGGALLDFAGFLAAIYKRGIAVAYFPTTLLAMVDAAFGGKTAIDVLGVKNLVGVVREPHAVFIEEAFLSTLPATEILSGFGELLKYGLLEGNPLWSSLLQTDPLRDTASLSPFIKEAIHIKKKYVSQDPYDHGVRRLLNLGHTVGHALEAFSRTAESSRPLLHGEAIALGMICELYLSHCRLGFPSTELHHLETFVQSYLAPFPIACPHYATLLKFVRQDKKKEGKELKIVLLESPGKAKVCSASEEEILKSLDYYRERFGY